MSYITDFRKFGKKVLTPIYTHAGGAHFDEMCAIALVRKVTKNPFIMRVKELPKYPYKGSWIVDIGGIHDPEKLRFDHHQDQQMPAAFQLVARYLGLESVLATQDWYHGSSQADTNLFGYYCNELGVPKQNLFRVLNNPVSAYVKQLFEKSPNSKVVWEIMDGFIEDAIQFGSRIVIKLESARILAEKQKVKDVCVLDLRNLPKGDIDNVYIANKLSGETQAHVTITPDDRGDGWSLFRVDFNGGAAMVNLSKLEGNPQVNFAHKAGFIAKVNKEADLMKLLEDSLV